MAGTGVDDPTWLTALQTGNEDALQWFAIYQASKIANTPATLALGPGGLSASANPNTLLLLGGVVIIAFVLFR